MDDFVGRFCFRYAKPFNRVGGNGIQIYQHIGSGFISIIESPDLLEIATDLKLNDVTHRLHFIYNTVNDCRRRLQHVMSFTPELLNRQPLFVKTFEEYVQYYLRALLLHRENERRVSILIKPLLPWFELMQNLKAKKDLYHIGHVLRVVVTKLSVIGLGIRQESRTIASKHQSNHLLEERQKALRHNVKNMSKHLDVFVELNKICLAFDLTQIKIGIAALQEKIHQTKRSILLRDELQPHPDHVVSQIVSIFSRNNRRSVTKASSDDPPIFERFMRSRRGDHNAVWTGKTLGRNRRTWSRRMSRILPLLR